MAESRDRNLAKLMYVLFDPALPPCHILDRSRQISGWTSNGVDVLWVPVHLKAGSVEWSEQFLRQGCMMGWPEVKKGARYVCGMTKKKYFSWLDGGGDSGDPERPRFGGPAPEGGKTVARPSGADVPISLEASLVLYNTFWFRNQVSKMEELPSYILDCEAAEYKKHLLGRILFFPAHTGWPVLRRNRKGFRIITAVGKARTLPRRVAVLLTWSWCEHIDKLAGRYGTDEFAGYPPLACLWNAYRTYERLDSSAEKDPGPDVKPFLVPSKDIAYLVADYMISTISETQHPGDEDGSSDEDGPEPESGELSEADADRTEPGEADPVEIALGVGGEQDAREDVPGSGDRTVGGAEVNLPGIGEGSSASGNGAEVLLAGIGEGSSASGNGAEVLFAGIGEGSSASGNGAEVLFAGIGEGSSASGNGDSVLLAAIGEDSFASGNGECCKACSCTRQSGDGEVGVGSGNGEGCRACCCTRDSGDGDVEVGTGYGNWACRSDRVLCRDDGDRRGQ
ncbi:MAG: hypothetical protein LBT40_11800 [Deltaproteobacteria bacterium]|nr:hypothetical protein [Deltaproteobacteria bacterium]